MGFFMTVGGLFCEEELIELGFVFSGHDGFSPDISLWHKIILARIVSFCVVLFLEVLVIIKKSTVS